MQLSSCRVYCSAVPRVGTKYEYKDVSRLYTLFSAYRTVTVAESRV